MNDAHTADEAPHLPHSGEEAHLLREVMRAHQALLGAFGRHVGMPAARLALLRVLAISGPGGLGTMEIARRLGVNAAAVSRQVKAMEAEGMVERSGDGRDGRRSYIRLTPGGLRTFLELHQRGHELEQRLAEAIGAEEMATAARVLARLRTVLDESP